MNWSLQRPKSCFSPMDEDSDDDWDLPSLDGILNRTESLIQPTEQQNPTGEQHQIEPSNVMLQGPTDQGSPVTVKMPRMPACGICRDRYCDSFFNPCGHLVCLVCAVELEERHQHCHICRQDIDKINPLYL
ncbi:hypothetical protein KP79_PYT22582 [Mizuhopecten yessoensis]|uniref:RING-type domain-containing protein n=1 Tax=Mizuhopecten yessoensis TaxID=6573 RepID=A0A210R511_MIZYE|nr:hypothetical protein KP79_PYT22582 [Mizuhopecten yessoensis]